MQMFPYWVRVLTRGSISLEKRHEHTLVAAAIGAQTPLVDTKGCSFQINTATQAGGQPVAWEVISKFKPDFGSYSSIFLAANVCPSMEKSLLSMNGSSTKVKLTSTAKDGGKWGSVQCHTIEFRNPRKKILWKWSCYAKIKLQNQKRNQFHCLFGFFFWFFLKTTD